ncbi:MAG TPA: SIMPL domain-containing protein [Terriglobales bacterium]|jgi:uncharacterized protein YggE|nr:SIMPL domain-containing protein [Terriglobales bacterium]
MKLSLALFAVLLAATSLAFGQDRPTVTAQPNTVYVSADGKFEANPDTAVVQFNISAQKNKSSEAYDRASLAAEQVRQILRSNGIDPKEAQIGTFSIQPVYDYSNAKQKLIGYRVNADVTLKLKDFAKVAPIAQQFSDMDVTGNQSVNYTLEEIDIAKTKAVEDAYRRARLSAAAIAKAGGRTLGDLSYASVDTFENVRVQPTHMGMQPMAKLQAAPAPTEEFTPQEVSVTAHVNAVFNLK